MPCRTTGPEKTAEACDTRPRVTVLLGTYNGARFLQEQLASLTVQTHTAWELWARDDGSTDATLDVLHRAAEGERRIHLVESHGERLGSTQNFATLLLRVHAEDGGCPYVMFCDQDDVWRPDKIEVTLAAMQQGEAEAGESMPLLVHTDFEFVDERLRPLGSMASAAHRLSTPEALVLNRLLSQNFIYGCTMMLNHALVNASVPIPHMAEQHDYWIALVAASVGRVVHVRKRTVFYRQHGSNVTASLEAASLSKRMQRMLRGWQQTARLNACRARQAHALARHVEHRASPDARRLLHGYLAAMSRGGAVAAWFAWRHGLRRQGPLQTGRYLLSLLATRSVPVTET